VDITGTAGEQLDDPLYSRIEAATAADRLYVKALVLREGATKVAIVTLDAVAIAEIGSIHNDYLANVRARLQEEIDLEPANLLVSASHCHGVVCADIEERTAQAVREACSTMVPVQVGVGAGHEDRIQENRRLKLRGGGEADVRHAYALPPDEEIEGVGPIDPQIGLLRLDRKDGRTLAVLYNFACHPIQGVASGANTADISGYASHVIERNMCDDTIALFVQGCAADINPVLYRDVDNPRDAEPHGDRLGFSALEALRGIACHPDARLRLVNESVRLPRADLTGAIAALKDEQEQVLRSLRPNSLNLKTFISLLFKHRLFPDFPSYDTHSYLHEEAMGRGDRRRLDAQNRQLLEGYTHNIRAMEQLTRIQVNLGLLEMHQAKNQAAGPTCEVEMVGLRVGDFVLVTFPGELSVETGLQIKRMSPHRHTYVASVTNGYIYYTPTVEQLANRGHAQEDSDCLVAPEWHQIFIDAAAEILEAL